MSIIDRLDDYYYSRKPSEVWLMVILLAVLIGYLLYTLLSPIASDFRKKEEERNIKLTTSINSAKSFLKTITVNGDRDYYIKDLNRKIVAKKMKLNEYRAKLSKLKGAMKQLNELLYTNDNWSKFLHDIATKANNNNLKVYNLSNQKVDDNGTFGKVLDVNIRCQGEYKDILSFINDLEQTKLVANVSNVRLEAAPKNPIADINVSVWGIKPWKK